MRHAAGTEDYQYLMHRDEFIVEVDVILPQSSTLHFAHDVGETIQCMLERWVWELASVGTADYSLDGVLRAYVQ